MKEPSRNNSEHTNSERIITAVFSFITFAIVGGVVRLFVDSITFSSLNDLMWQFLPFMFGFGGVAGILAYFYPKAFQIIMCFLPVPGSSN